MKVNKLMFVQSIENVRYSLPREYVEFRSGCSPGIDGEKGV